MLRGGRSRLGSWITAGLSLTNNTRGLDWSLERIRDGKAASAAVDRANQRKVRAQRFRSERTHGRHALSWRAGLGLGVVPGFYHPSTASLNL